MEKHALFVSKDVSLARKGCWIPGELLFLPHHIVFRFNTGLEHASATREIWICHPMVEHVAHKHGISGALKHSNVERGIQDSPRNAPLTNLDPCRASHLKLSCRDYTFYSFNFVDDDACVEAYNIFSKIAMSYKGNGSKFYANEYVKNTLEQRVQLDGWDLYKPQNEYSRLGLWDNKNWRATKLNNDYSFCPLYPLTFIIPSLISDTLLKHAGKFRLKQRVPAVVYRHRIGGNHNVIARCAQPLVGLRLQNRLIQDEKLVTEIFQEQARERASRAQHDDSGEDLSFAQQQPQRNILVDLRPITNAMAQHALGAGTENPEYYQINQSSQDSKRPSRTLVDRIFCNIDNIHVIRDASNKLTQILSDYDDCVLEKSSSDVLLQFQQRLHKTQWLHLLSVILQSVDRITKSVHFNNTNVVIHCLDGWDRTLQVSALLQLCLDPYYRTMKGFMVLIEKEWVSFGFKFKTRANHGGCIGARIPKDMSTANISSASSDDSEVAPSVANAEATNESVLGFAGVTSFLLRAATHIKNGAGIVQENSDTMDRQLFHHRPFLRTYSGSNEKLPVFHQFLDCVYQLIRQHPTNFEFNSRFLKRLFYHYYSCQYGTFLNDSEKQMVENNVRSTTVSVWDYFESRPTEFTNTLYAGDPDNIVLFNYLDVKWWHDLYGRSDQEMNGFSQELEKKLALMKIG